MENILPFLAGLAYMAYKVYSNYQKEQEEARNRKPSQPYEAWVEEQDVYSPKSILDKEVPAEKYHEPKYEPAYKEPRVDKVRKKPAYKEDKALIPQRVELYNPEVPAEEVVKNRAIHEPHKHKFVASQEEVDVYSDFDFRDAIVKEAILNRPQY